MNAESDHGELSEEVQMNTQTENDLSMRAKEAGAVVRRELDDGEAARRLTRASLEALREAGLLRLYVPKSLGGLEVDPITCARLVEEMSEHHSAAGWAVMVANAVAWWCARLPAEGVEEIYAAGADSFVATAFHPPVTAVDVDGGYRLSGRARLASNVHDASWVMLTAVVAGEGKPADAAPEFIAAIFSPHEAEILDTWRSLGMRATDSNDVEVRDVFVPGRRTFKFMLEYEPNRYYTGPLYRMPALGAALAPWAATAVAIASCGIREFRELAERKTPFSSTVVLRERRGAQYKLGRALALYASARSLLYQSIAEGWERTLANEAATLEQKTDLLMAAVNAVSSASGVLELLYSAAGTTAIYDDNPIERHFRDIQVLKQHGFMSDDRYETIGQVYLGLEPDLSLVAF